MEDFDVEDPMADSHAMANREVINNSIPHIHVSEPRDMISHFDLQGELN